MSDQIAKRSEELFKQKFCCAESVLLAIAESRGVKSDLIPRLATGFCGGLGRSGGLCGVLSGGILAINLVHGRNSAEESPDLVHRLVRELLAKFQARHGSTQCEQLIGCRLDTPEGHRFFVENNLREKCQAFVRDATSLAGALIDEGAKARTQH